MKGFKISLILIFSLMLIAVSAGLTFSSVQFNVLGSTTVSETLTTPFGGTETISIHNQGSTDFNGTSTTTSSSMESDVEATFTGVTEFSQKDQVNDVGSIEQYLEQPGYFNFSLGDISVNNNSSMNADEVQMTEDTTMSTFLGIFPNNTTNTIELEPGSTATITSTYTSTKGLFFPKTTTQVNNDTFSGSGSVAYDWNTTFPNWKVTKQGTIGLTNP